MEPIRSGSTNERIVRTSLVTFLAAAVAGWCFYDANIGYPMENLHRATEGLDPPITASGELILPQVDADVPATIDPGTFLKHLKPRFGEPAWRGENAKGKDEVRYFGPAGQLIITLDRADGITADRYEPAEYKPQTDLDTQTWMGIVVGIVAALLLLHWARVLIVRATLTDQGLKLTGKPLVPFEAITGMQSDNYPKKGWVELEYSVDGRSGKLRMDDYRIKAFPEMIAEICRRKEYENPHEAWQAQKQRSTTG
ncbi:MAG: hypothetical protein GY842_07800 [bacterium]|nr:hypothetical protein [bacterium]